MQVRELVLNGASAQCDNELGPTVLAELLIAMSQGMARAVASKLSPPELRAVEPLSTLSVRGVQVWDVLLNLLRSRQSLEEVTFLMGIAHRTPLLTDVKEHIAGAFYSATHENGLPGGDGIVFCAVTGGISVSLETSGEWSGDEITVELLVLNEGAELERRVERVDNICNVRCTQGIEQRTQASMATATRTRDFWDRRGTLFPNLAFGDDVQSQVLLLDEATFSLVRSRLLELNATSAQWKRDGSAAPAYRSCVTPESRSTMDNPALVRARTFRDGAGGRQIYEWHARFGAGGRIHFYPDIRERTVEVGYIGPHLPL